jgi:predicted GNAT family N-acyltransferase
MSPELQLSIRRCETQEELETCKRLRWTVFVEEQGVPPSLEHDEHDRLPEPGEARAPVHALVEWIAADGRRIPCAAGRFIWKGEALAKLQRMAVIDDARGRGVGARLLAFLEGEARRLGAVRFTLGAQVHARGFYERAGYAATSGVFDDAGIPHVTMEKAA